MWKMITALLWVIVWRVVVNCYGLLCGELWYFIMGYFVASGGNLFGLLCGESW